MSFLFTPKNQLLLKVRLFHNSTEVSLSLAKFMQYLYEHETDFTKEENDFCYTLGKLVKKVDFKGRLIYAIPNDYDMAMFFKKIMNTKIVLKWERN